MLIITVCLKWPLACAFGDDNYLLLSMSEKIQMLSLHFFPIYIFGFSRKFSTPDSYLFLLLSSSETIEVSAFLLVFAMCLVLSALSEIFDIRYLLQCNLAFYKAFNRVSEVFNHYVDN